MVSVVNGRIAHKKTKTGRIPFFVVIVVVGLVLLLLSNDALLFHTSNNFDSH